MCRKLGNESATKRNFLKIWYLVGSFYVICWLSRTIGEKQKPRKESMSKVARQGQTQSSFKNWHSKSQWCNLDCRIPSCARTQETNFVEILFNQQFSEWIVTQTRQEIKRQTNQYAVIPMYQCASSPLLRSDSSHPKDNSGEGATDLHWSWRIPQRRKLWEGDRREKSKPQGLSWTYVYLQGHDLKVVQQQQLLLLLSQFYDLLALPQVKHIFLQNTISK